MLNVDTFEGKFALAATSKFNVNSIQSRKEAWEVYYNLMMESPHLLKTMPETEKVVSTMKTVFHNVDWVN